MRKAFIKYTTMFNCAVPHQEQYSNVSTAWSTIKANIAYQCAGLTEGKFL